MNNPAGSVATIHQGPDADPRLLQIGPGLTCETVIAAVTRGVSAKDDAAEGQFPRIFPGIAAWGHTVSGLRDILVTKHDWRINEVDNFSRTVSPDGKHQIIVASGNAYTGREFGHATTSRKKGKMTKSAVQDNWDLFSHREMIPFSDMVSSEIESERNNGPSTWYLLVHFAKSQVRIEVSIPQSFDNGRVSAWRERVLVPAIGLPEGGLDIEPQDFGPSGIVDIQVTAVR